MRVSQRGRGCRARTTPAFQGSINTAIRAFQRALDLDPTYHIAFQHILDALANNGGRRTGYDRAICPGDRTQPSCTYYAFVRRDHDTLVTVPVLATDSVAFAAQLADYVKSEARRKNLEQALATAATWAASAPDESRPHNALGFIYGQLGDPTNAEAQFAQVKGKLIDSEASKYLVGRTEALTQLGRTAQLHRLLDSAIKSPDRRSDFVPQQLGVLIGRFAPIDSARPAQNGVNGAYQGVVARAIVTGGDEVVAGAERALIDLMRTNGSWTDTAPSRLPTFQAAVRMPRTWPPLVYPKSDHLRAAIVVAVAKGDTARLRAEARWIDSVVLSRPTTISDSGASVILADAFLVLRDSASALRVVRRALDSIWVQTPTTSTPMLNNLPVILAWPRMALLRGELEAAVGSKSVAREWYQRFLDLWAGADPEFAPMLTRARQGLASLGTR